MKKKKKGGGVGPPGVAKQEAPPWLDLARDVSCEVADLVAYCCAPPLEGFEGFWGWR
jgi:hypothetical protein